MKVEVPKFLPVLLVTDGVVFPSTTVRIQVKAKQNMIMVEECLLNRGARNMIVAVLFKEPENRNDEYLNSKLTQEDAMKGVHSVGTAAMVSHVMGSNWPRPSYSVQMTGLCRIKITGALVKNSYMTCRIEQQPVEVVGREQYKEFLSEANTFADLLSTGSPQLMQLKRVVDEAPVHVVADLCASIVHGSYAEKLAILDATTLNEAVEKTRFLMILYFKKRQREKDEKPFTVEMFPGLIRSDELTKIINSVFGNSDNNTGSLGRRGPPGGFRRRSLSGSSGDTDELAQLEAKLKSAGMAPDVEQLMLSELKKLQEMSPLSPESSSVRNYLELMADLPWSKETKDNIDIQKARENFDADHFGMVDVKKRVLEYLAVQKLRQSLKGPILCFVGPPGVGKTSIARSIAYTMGRKFHRISLGGVSDQSDIRGHRRTYIGSMPGRIIQGVKRARVRNPVFLLDEIDKLSAGIHGDPAAALLEVLDPEQNSHFVDHYVNVQFDLSKVLFVATANSTSTIPAALMDRMEVIQVSGYTRDEKVAIATRYLIPKQVKEHGLVVKDEIAVDFKPEALQFIVGRYTREAGVRSLERRVGAVCRAVALRHAELPEDSVHPPRHFPNVVIDVEAVEHILGVIAQTRWKLEVTDTLETPANDVRIVHCYV